MSKKRMAAVILALSLLLGALFGCVTVLEAGTAIRISNIRRINVTNNFVGVATDQHYYAMYLGNDIAHPIKIDQLD
jgi:cell division septal protein FtsQ